MTAIRQIPYHEDLPDKAVTARIRRIIETRACRSDGIKTMRCQENAVAGEVASYQGIPKRVFNAVFLTVR
jgi:hypothetical protein